MGGEGHFGRAAHALSVQNVPRRVNSLGTKCPVGSGTIRPIMIKTTERLAWLRQLGEFASKKGAADAYGINYEIYKKLASGGRGLTPEHTETIANWHKVSPGWLMFGEGTPKGKMVVPLQGDIGAGQEMIEFVDTSDQGQHVSGLIADPGAVAFRVKGDSMLPLARNADIVFFGRPARGADIRRLIGQECAVRLVDGRRFFKVLERGSRSGVYDLHSYNKTAEPIREVEVHEAGPLLGLRRH